MSCKINQKKLCGKKSCRVCFKRSFANHPRSKNWSKKNEILPYEVFRSSNIKCYFDCDKCPHSFESYLGHILENKWCPFCSKPSRKLCDKSDCKLCLKKSFAYHFRAKHWSSKNILSPRKVFISSHNKYWFDCDKCLHDFEGRLDHISNNTWCPYCSNKKLCDNPDCKVCLEKSFANHPRSKNWSSRNEDNPRDVFLSDNDKYWFNCDICYHDFESKPSNISSKKKHWCPFCANQKLCNKENCQICLEKSFINHPRVKNWSSENKIKPRAVFLSSGIKYIFNCEKCHHKIESTPNAISSGKWCIFCANQKLCNEEDCQVCFEKSFVSHPRSKNWSLKNKAKPRDVFRFSHTKYWFDCDCNINRHSFECSLAHISNDRWCPLCKNKTEKKLYQWLNENYNYEIKHQIKYIWCKNFNTKKLLPFDFAIKELKLIIELDGEQHFSQVSNWKNNNETRKRDIYKMKQALKNGHTIIRLLQDDVFYNKNNWKTKLKESIKSYNTPEIITICEGNKYELHLSDMKNLL